MAGEITTETNTHSQVGIAQAPEPAARSHVNFAPAAKRLGKKHYVIFALLAALVVGALAFNYFRGQVSGAAKTPPPVVTVTVEPAAVHALDKKLTVTGTVSAWDPITIGAEIGGLKIVSVNVEEGDLVKKGQVLAKLNSDVLQAELNQVKAKLQASEADLKKAIQPNRVEEIASMKAAYQASLANVGQEDAGLAQMRATLSEAEHNALRYHELGSQGAVSEADAENRETTAKTALAQVHNAEQKVASAKQAAEQERQKLKMAQTGGRQEDVQIAKANLAELKANRAQLEAQVAQTKICAPEDGLITKRDAHLGDIASSGQSLFWEVRANRLELKAQVSDQDLGKFACGQKVDIEAVTSGAAPVNGQVRIVSPLVDETTRLGTVRVDIPEHSALKPGMFVRGMVDLGQSKALSVPAKAVLARDGLPYVFVLNGNHADFRSVTLGTRAADFIEIVSGVSLGEQVIVKGAGFLKDGDVVAVGQ